MKNDGSLDGWRMLIWVGTILCLSISIWIPCDSIAVPEGRALPQVLLWLLIGLFLAFDRFRNGVRILSPKSEGSSESLASGSQGTLRFLFCGGLLSWVALGILLLPGHGNMRSALHVGWEWVAMGSACWILKEFVGHPRYRRHMILLLIGLSLTAAIHGEYQYFVSMPHDRALYEADPDRVLRENDLQAPPGSTARMQFENRLYSTEPFGPYSLANSLAGLLVPCTLLTLALVAQTKNWRTATAWMWGAVLVAQVVCLVLTKSRAAWIALAVASLFYFVGSSEIRWWLHRHRSRIAIGIVVGMVLLLAGIYAVDPLIIKEAPKSLWFRCQYWISTAALIADHPWFGIGPGNFQARYPAYKLVEASETIADPHSLWFEMAATSGLPALGLFALLIGSLFVPWKVEEKSANEVKGSDETVEQNLQLVSATSIGILLAAGLVWWIPGLIGIPPEGISYALSIPWMVAILWLPLPVEGRSAAWASPLVWRSALAGCLVHLSGSGGWMTPGNMIPLVIFVTMIASQSERGLGRVLGISVRPSTVSLVAVGGMALAILGFVRTAWLPYFAVLRWESEARKAIATERAIALAEETVVQAPYSREPLRAVVQGKHQLLMERLAKGQSHQEELAELYAALARWLERSPHDWSMRANAGETIMSLTPYTRTELPKAIRFWEEAIERHPTEAWLPLQAAIACWLNQDLARSKEFLARAEELNERNPHWDHKLGMARVYWPTLNDRGNVPKELMVRPASDPASPPDFCEGEPARQTLRKLLQM